MIRAKIRNLLAVKSKGLANNSGIVLQAAPVVAAAEEEAVTVAVVSTVAAAASSESATAASVEVEAAVAEVKAVSPASSFSTQSSRAIKGSNSSLITLSAAAAVSSLTSEVNIPVEISPTCSLKVQERTSIPALYDEDETDGEKWMLRLFKPTVVRKITAFDILPPKDSITSPVFLYMYHIPCQNAFLRGLTVMIVHTAVVVGDFELTFGPGNGVNKVAPGQQTGWDLFKMKKIGEYCPAEGALEQAQQLLIDFAANTYRRCSHNCNHFAAKYLMLVTGKKPPRWVNAVACAASYIPFNKFDKPRPAIKVDNTFYELLTASLKADKAARLAMQVSNAVPTAQPSSVCVPSSVSHCTAPSLVSTSSTSLSSSINNVSLLVPPQHTVILPPSTHTSSTLSTLSSLHSTLSTSAAAPPADESSISSTSSAAQVTVTITAAAAAEPPPVSTPEPEARKEKSKKVGKWKRFVSAAKKAIFCAQDFMAQDVFARKPHA